MYLKSLSHGQMEPLGWKMHGFFHNTHSSHTWCGLVWKDTRRNEPQEVWVWGFEDLTSSEGMTGCQGHIFLALEIRAIAWGLVWLDPKNIASKHQTYKPRRYDWISSVSRVPKMVNHQLFTHESPPGALPRTFGTSAVVWPPKRWPVEFDCGRFGMFF